MADTDATPPPLVPGAHRFVRELAPREGPFTGALVTDGTSVAVCADAVVLGEWPGWRFGGAEHVAGPVDLLRRVDGHDVLLPWCTERVSVFLGRRRAAGVPLSAGEVGTLVVSLVRGLRELEAGAASVQGDWWMTHDGRPLFVFGAGPAAQEGAEAVLALLAADVTDRALSRTLRDVTAGMARPRITVADEERWEHELFAIAAPRALRTEVFAPERVREIDSRRGAREGTASPAADAGHDRAARDIRARIESALLAVRERMRTPRAIASAGAIAPPGDREGAGLTGGGRPRASRRRPALLAGAAAAAVLGIGLLWPAEAAEEKPPGGAAVGVVSDSPAAAPTSTTEDSRGAETAAPPTAPTATPTPPSAHADAAEAAVPALLDRIAECAVQGDAVCADAMAEGAVLPEAGAVRSGSAAVTVTPVDDYGDLAVVRLTPGDGEGGDQMLVLVRRNDIWLVRDVYDVADQPE